MKQAPKKPSYKVMSSKKENALWVIAVIVWIGATALGIYIIWSNS